MTYRASRLLYSAVVLCSLLAWGVQAAAQVANTTTLMARLSGASIVPPNDSKATGNLQASLDKETRVLTWNLTTNGLSGPPIGASLHAPAMPGENAAVAVPLPLGKGVEGGTVTLTAVQIDHMLAGRAYVNVVTTAAPEGEIRGQLLIGR
jgi:hypothetical protein